MQGWRLVLVIGSILAIAALLLYGLYNHYFYSRYHKQLTSVALTARFIKESVSKFFRSLTELFRVNQAVDSENLGRTSVIRRVQEPIFDALPLDVLNLECDVRAGPAERVVQQCQRSEPLLTAGETPIPSVTAAKIRLGAADDDHVIVLYVVAYQCASLYGDPLLRSLLQLGFRYGERAIFHRHLNPMGSGPILFSLVNMVKPGTFNLSNMREFTTPGVALCMNVPAYGDTLQNFKLMLQAAQRLADDVSGMVLDDERQMLTPQKSEYYKAHIRRLLTTTE